jgi:hypothetical protein
MAEQRKKAQSTWKGSAGLSGALKDAIEAVSKAYGPKSITQRKQRLKQLEDEAQGENMDTSKMKAYLRRKRGVQYA